MNMVMFNDLECLVCRPALPQDTDQMLELCSHIWQGNDYIPHVWNEWMADPDGLLGVAELNGRVAGLFKLAKFQEKEWYLEGLRVHPDFRDRGVASHIHTYVVETWRKMGSGSLRLVTHSENIKVHHMCEQGGFRRIAEFIPYQAAAIPGGQADFRLVKMEEAQAAFDFVLASQSHALSAGLVNLEWVYADPQLKHLEEAIGENHAWWWRDGAGVLSAWVEEEDGVPMPGIQLAGCPISDLPELLMDYRRLAGDLGYTGAVWVVPNVPEALTAVGKAGFERYWDKSLYVYELRSGEGS